MLVLLPLLAVLCAFCHAPGHAYDQLNEHPEISRDGLCANARERLRMAATLRPEHNHDLTGFGLVYLWNERAHAWEVVRDVGLCYVCGSRTWKHPHDPARSCCAKCSQEVRLLAYTLHHGFVVPPMTAVEEAAAEARLLKEVVRKPVPIRPQTSSPGGPSGDHSKKTRLLAEKVVLVPVAAVVPAVQESVGGLTETPPRARVAVLEA